MKGIGRVVSLSIIGLMILFLGNGSMDLKAQQGNPGTGTQAPQEKKQKQDGLVVDWLNDFESCEDWRATSTCPLGDTKIRKIPGKPRPVNTEGKAVNENGEPGEFQNEITDENGISHKNEYVLGVKTYLLDRGFDRVEVSLQKNTSYAEGQGTQGVDTGKEVPPYPLCKAEGLSRRSAQDQDRQTGFLGMEGDVGNHSRMASPVGQLRAS
jgi:hypothetical protein